MGFFRRLFGGTEVKSKPQAAKPASEAKPEPARPEPQISAPGATVETARPEPVVQGDTAPGLQRFPDPIITFGATRQLEPLESATLPNKHLIYGLSSDVGVVRTNNQDSLYALFAAQTSVDGVADFSLFVVADGMGGHSNGERASALASRVVAQHILTNFYLKTMGNIPEDERPFVSEVLIEAFQKANQQVADEVPEGGTTVTAVAIVGDMAHFAHVGDSRAYLLTADDTDQITRDHSLVQRLIELDQITPDEAAFHPQRNVLYRAIGQNEQVDIDTATRRLPPGSRLLLCSDGLWNQVPEQVLVGTAMTAANPQDACDKLVTLANERGGNDNVTVILIQMPG